MPLWNDNYKKKMNYNPESAINAFIKFENDYNKARSEADQAVNDYWEDIRKRQEKYTANIVGLTASMKKIDNDISEAESSLAAAVLEDSSGACDSIREKIDALYRNRDRFSRELAAFTKAVETIDGDPKLYKKVLAKYDALKVLRSEFLSKRNKWFKIAEEQVNIWQDFSNRVTYTTMGKEIKTPDLKKKNPARIAT